ncbi:MAG: arylsulfatase [Planctomycetota bacterium]|nr:arylsulfatase [Planctomycetota bacterium]
MKHNPACLMALCFLWFAPLPAATDPPNIIYVMVDDLGYGDLGCYGQEIIQTPNIDRLSREGLKFTDHYAGHTVCRPSRLVLLTGKHSGNTPIHGNTNYSLPPKTQTVTTLLKQAGYQTGGVGKWALGSPGSQGVPTLQGFDYWFGYLDQGRAHNFYPAYLWENNSRFPLVGNVEGPKRNVSTERVTYSHDVMHDQAMAFIRKNAKQRFFLQAHYTIPHANNEGGRATGNGQEVPDHGIYAQEDWPDPEKGFAAMITRLDSDIGEMMALLKQLKIDNNTLVFFTSDNGPHQEGGHKMEFFNSNGALRGYKRDLYDGGIRVPLIARWPGVIQAGAQTHHPSAFWDFLPTACELAGIKPPNDTDGISYVPTLLGKPQPKHDYLFWRAGKKFAVRKDQWKAVRVGDQKPIELYDLSQDISEKNNLAADHPEQISQFNAIITRHR